MKALYGNFSPKTEVRVKHMLVGPKHDPYSRSTYEAQVGDQHLLLVCCSLAGTSLEINGVIHSRSNYCTSIGGSGSDPATLRVPIEEFERIVGRKLEEIDFVEGTRFDEDSMGPPSRYE